MRVFASRPTPPVTLPADLFSPVTTTLPLPPATWEHQAACAKLSAGAVDALFFDADPRTEAGRRDLALARRICAACPVVEQCADYAESRAIPHGMFAGRTARERLGTAAR